MLFAYYIKANRIYDQEFLMKVKRMRYHPLTNEELDVLLEELQMALEYYEEN